MKTNFLAIDKQRNHVTERQNYNLLLMELTSKSTICFSLSNK